MSRKDEAVVTASDGGRAFGAGKRRRGWSVFGLGGTPDEGTGPAAVKFEVKLLDECGAMLRYASTRGMEVPPRAAYTVRELDNKRIEQGKKWSPKPQDAADLAAAHGHLSRLVDPATPKSITLVNEQSPHSRWVALFGAVLVVRVMMVLAIVSLLAFLVLLPIVGDDPADAIASPSWGRGLLGALYIVLAAGFGGLFSHPFLIHRQKSQ